MPADEAPAPAKPEAIRKLFNRMLESVEDCDEELTQELLDKARQSGWELVIEQTPGEAESDGDTTVVSVKAVLKLGPEIVAQWESVYGGHYGCGGTGWWVGQCESTMPSGVSEVLEAAGLEEELPEVPEPDEDDF